MQPRPLLQQKSRVCLRTFGKIEVESGRCGVFRVEKGSKSPAQEKEWMGRSVGGGFPGMVCVDLGSWPSGFLRSSLSLITQSAIHREVVDLQEEKEDNRFDADHRPFCPDFIYAYGTDRCINRVR